jgi:hypothetical protein
MWGRGAPGVGLSLNGVGINSDPGQPWADNWQCLAGTGMMPRTPKKKKKKESR